MRRCDGGCPQKNPTEPHGGCLQLSCDRSLETVEYAGYCNVTETRVRTAKNHHRGGVSAKNVTLTVHH
jgi:hypothetical protein